MMTEAERTEFEQRARELFDGSVDGLDARTRSRLSQARAETVGQIIRASLSDASRLTTKGMGDTVPLTTNENAEGKSQNRRVEVIVPRRY